MRERDVEPLDEKPERKLLRPPMPGAGRPLGAVNKFTRELKTALLDAAILSDFAKDPNDEAAPHSLTNYCLAMIQKYPELYFQALMKLLPREVNTRLQNDTTLDITYRTIAEVKHALEESGMPRTQIAAIAALMPDTGKPLDEEARDEVEDILLDRDRGAA